MSCRIERADAIEFLNSLEPASIDLVFGSPPYEQARLYLEDGNNIGIARRTEIWVAWMVEVFRASLRACKGLVAFLVEGQTKNFRYSAGPMLLAADLHRAGIHLRKPPIFHRVGIPGSGGPDWLRSDTEFIICATNGGQLPWSDNTAKGKPPKYAPGGAMSHRNAEGKHKNESNGPRFQEKQAARKFGHNKNGDTKGEHGRFLDLPLANPGNKIEQTYTASEVAELMGELHNVRSHIVGGGVMGGDAFCSQNEAPFPEALAEFFVQSFCPPGGLVCDPFSGSGTTAAVSIRHGRNFVGCDLRQSQVDLGIKRVAAETPLSLLTE